MSRPLLSWKKGLGTTPTFTVRTKLAETPGGSRDCLHLSPPSVTRPGLRDRRSDPTTQTGHVGESG